MCQQHRPQLFAPSPSPSSAPPRAKLYYLRNLTGKSARLKEVFVSREERLKGEERQKAAAAAAAAKQQ